MSDLYPPWLYDLVTAIENHEDVHAKGWACFGAALAAVPLETRREARAIAAYNGAKPTHATEAEHGPFRVIAQAEMDSGNDVRPMNADLHAVLEHFLSAYSEDSDDTVIEAVGTRRLTVGNLRDLVAAPLDADTNGDAEPPVCPGCDHWAASHYTGTDVKAGCALCPCRRSIFEIQQEA